ncbi:hypothetical protein NQ315_017545 [Exocentrus adspersus]|uniref:Tyr recombinase domain-containing protein n=1 Tax=Exocentrus adspersus TaxID=1586481 RepID=A0AAV8V5S1_9CUCU|nr:hypothetical protein NQ315_017545 [Exocentrus adspersus]
MDHALLVNVRNTKNNVDRNFIINNSNKNGIDLIEVCRKYMALRKPETTHSRFFVRTSASLLADSGASIDVLKRHGGWKSASVAEGYIENSINTKKIVADSIFGLGVGNSTESASAHQVSGSAVSASSASSTSSKNNIVQNTIDGANGLLNIAKRAKLQRNTFTERKINGGRPGSEPELGVVTSRSLHRVCADEQISISYILKTEKVSTVKL